MERAKLALVGLGPRGETLMAAISFIPELIQVTAICDLCQDRIDKMLKRMADYGMERPAVYTDYHEMLKDENVQGVLAATSWNSHLKIAKDTMKAGKYASIEVGGASSVEELWDLVRASEETGVSCMMLENCCFARNELMVLNMVRQGLFGELVYCEGGYEHDLRSDLIRDFPLGQERAHHNCCRNGDLYPTHQLGPIAKILRINRGNRFVYLTSTASKACGLEDMATRKNLLGPDGKPQRFKEGDVVTTVIKCANGETITLTHCVSLPRPYSRDGRIQGTKGIWLEDAHAMHIEGISPTEEHLDIAGNPYIIHKWTPVQDLYEKYDHPLWKAFPPEKQDAHGGLDVLTLSAFAEAVINHTQPPIDVYDVAAWMSVTCLSEQSVAMGSMPVPFPDFTNGRWMDPPPPSNSKWSLD